MSNTLPTAPPPPPQNVLNCDNNECHSTKPKPLLEECLWSLEHPELQKACFLARICLRKRPKSCKFHNISSILQVGPTCGLTALSMLLGGMPTADHLLHEAKERHFSYMGEMFSAFYLYQLVCDYLPIIHNNNHNGDDPQINRNANDTDNEQQQQTLNKLIDCQMHEGRLNCAKVRDALTHGACIFVPYPF